MGSLFKRKWKRKDGTVVVGDTWWIQYYDNTGKQHREPTETTDRAEAARLLKKREGRVAEGKPVAIRYDRVKFSELAQLYLQDYQLNNKKVDNAERYVRQLASHFGRLRVVNITTTRVNEYKLQRQEEGAANATINRELSALKRMLYLGAAQQPPLVDRVPPIELLRENNVRKGFFERPEFEAMREHLPDHLKGIATFGYYSGWRKGEITKLQWSGVDRRKWTVRLEGDETKNREARTIHLDPECKEVFKREWERRKEIGTALPYVFLNANGTDRVKRFDKAWNSACKKAGIAGKLFHDLRRTAVRNMVRRGILERVAMQISGHKTRSVFERYNIVDDKDLKRAAELMAQDPGTELGTEQEEKRKVLPINV